jgi:hypothetical protein
MPKEKQQISKANLATVSNINLIEAQLLNLPLSAQCEPLLKQSGPKLHRLAKLCRLGLCNFK